MNDNWWALYIATQIEVTPDEAMRLFCFGRKNKRLNLQQKINIKKAKKEGYDKIEIASIFGIAYSSVGRILGEMKGVEV